jgi:BMFP domain-containing protein YqiC
MEQGAEPSGYAMSQNSRIFDDLGRLMNEAAGVADGVRREVETVVKGQAQRFVADMDLVKREDFDALRELVQVQGEEIDALRKELAALKGTKSKTN